MKRSNDSSSLADKKRKKKIKVVSEIVEKSFISAEDLDMSAWNVCPLKEPLMKGLKDLKFQQPTKIQEETIPLALKRNDILGAAETGSGKTLAFGLPILNSLLSIKEFRSSDNENSFYCLILTPTRELAIQIKNHLVAVSKYTDIKVAVVVGGMAPEKQRRILKKNPEIVVATPGRLWELFEEGEEHLSQMPNVRFFVIDEADRMVEKGHFAELTQILSIMNAGELSRKRQTFVFSATLTLVHDLPSRLAMKGKKGMTKQKQKLGSLVKLIGMKNPEVVDITKKTAVVDSLTETHIMCNNEDKDSYLYYFLVKHPGRTLVFCNSIDCVRRLRSVLELLECKPLPLHASMQQRQRLKNLERFEKSATGILLATDVAARGLDIKGIEHVIHFQVPRTAETYVHRSGRTARAQNEGLSLMLIEPQDASFYRKICKTLNRDDAMPMFPVDQRLLKLIKERVTLARSIDKMEHRMKRLTAQNRWFENAAKEMDVDIEEENLLHDLGQDSEVAAKTRTIKAMKKRLAKMVSKPIVSNFFNSSYPTKTGKLINLDAFNPEKAVMVAKKMKKKHI